MTFLTNNKISSISQFAITMCSREVLECKFCILVYFNWLLKWLEEASVETWLIMFINYFVSSSGVMFVSHTLVLLNINYQANIFVIWTWLLKIFESYIIISKSGSYWANNNNNNNNNKFNEVS